MNRALIGVLVFLSLVASALAVYTRSLYPASLLTHEKEYEKLVRLMLACCSKNDYWRSLEELEDEGDTERVALMRKLSLTDVHSYPGNKDDPGGVVRLERRLGGPFITLYVYSLKQQPGPYLYGLRRVKGRWYQGNTFLP